MFWEKLVPWPKFFIISSGDPSDLKSILLIKSRLREVCDFSPFSSFHGNVKFLDSIFCFFSNNRYTVAVVGRERKRIMKGRVEFPWQTRENLENEKTLLKGIIKLVIFFKTSTFNEDCDARENRSKVDLRVIRTDNVSESLLCFKSFFKPC